MVEAPRQPNPPASETAATSRGYDTPPMPASMTGCSMSRARSVGSAYRPTTYVATRQPLAPARVRRCSAKCGGSESFSSSRPSPRAHSTVAIVAVVLASTQSRHRGRVLRRCRPGRRPRRRHDPGRVDAPPSGVSPGKFLDASVEIVAPRAASSPTPPAGHRPRPRPRPSRPRWRSGGSGGVLHELGSWLRGLLRPPRAPVQVTVDDGRRLPDRARGGPRPPEGARRAEPINWRATSSSPSMARTARASTPPRSSRRCPRPPARGRRSPCEVTAAPCPPASRWPMHRGWRSGPSRCRARRWR